MVPRSFHVTVKAAGEVLNLRNSEVTAPVYDDGVAVGALEVEKVDAPNGRVKITITQAVYDAIGRYATWRFHEGTVFDYPLIERQLVKASAKTQPRSSEICCTKSSAPIDLDELGPMSEPRSKWAHSQMPSPSISG
jgi:hypothetical protein